MISSIEVLSLLLDIISNVIKAFALVYSLNQLIASLDIKIMVAILNNIQTSNTNVSTFNKVVAKLKKLDFWSSYQEIHIEMILICTCQNFTLRKSNIARLLII